MRHTWLIGATLMMTQMTTQAEIRADYNFAGNLSSDVVGAPDIEYLGVTKSYETGVAQGVDVNAISIEHHTGLKLDSLNLSLCEEYSVVIQG